MMAISQSSGGQRPEHDSIAVVAQLHLCFAERKPGDVVDLVQRLRFAAEWAHRPVTDALRASAPVRVFAGRKLEFELAGDAGLFLDLTEGALLVTFAFEGLS